MCRSYTAWCTDVERRLAQAKLFDIGTKHMLSVLQYCTVFLLLRRAVWFIMEAASTSETSVNFYQTTRRNNPEDSHLDTRSIENLKTHPVFLSSNS
jgi:hypothetical protein